MLRVCGVCLHKKKKKNKWKKLISMCLCVCVCSNQCCIYALSKHGKITRMN